MLRDPYSQPVETIQGKTSQEPVAAAGSLAGPGLQQELEQKRQDYFDALARAQQIGAAAAETQGSPAGAEAQRAATEGVAPSPVERVTPRRRAPVAEVPAGPTAAPGAAKAQPASTREASRPGAGQQVLTQAPQGAQQGAGQVQPRVEGNLTPQQAARMELSQQGKTPASASKAAAREMGTTSEAKAGRRQVRHPAVDVFDEGEHLVLEFELPGVKADEIELMCDDEALSLRASSNPGRSLEDLVQSERGQVEFQRQLSLGVGIEPDSTKASFDDGILTVQAAKKDPKAGPKRIEIAD